jgi:hypothetical protein
VEELGRVIFLLLRRLFSSWVTHAPDGVKRTALFLFAIFLLLLLLWSIWHFMIWVCRGIFYFVERGSKLNLTVDSFRIVVPQVLKVPLLICMFGLFLAAVGHFPYDFYVLLRVAVFATCAVEFLSFRESQRTIWSGALLLTGLMYNPVFPIRLHRSTWVVINWATLFLFGAMLGLMKSEGMVAKLIDPSLPGGRVIQGTGTVNSERRS